MEPFDESTSLLINVFMMDKIFRLQLLKTTSLNILMSYSKPEEAFELMR
jgi:hypothetical protein